MGFYPCYYSAGSVWYTCKCMKILCSHNIHVVERVNGEMQALSTNCGASIVQFAKGHIEWNL